MFLQYFFGKKFSIACIMSDQRDQRDQRLDRFRCHKMLYQLYESSGCTYFIMTITINTHNTTRQAETNVNTV